MPGVRTCGNIAPKVAQQQLFPGRERCVQPVLQSWAPCVECLLAALLVGKMLVASGEQSTEDDRGSQGVPLTRSLCVSLC